MQHCGTLRGKNSNIELLSCSGRSIVQLWHNTPAEKSHLLSGPRNNVLEPKHYTGK